jgi:hypothetical protein
MRPEQIEEWRFALKEIHKDSDNRSEEELAEIDALCDLALKGQQAEAVREAIGRAVEKMKNSMGHKEHDCKRISSAIADLEHALNERKET